MTAAAPESLLSARRLAVGHGRRAMLPPIDLEVRRGELWGVLGRNGSGKTTLVRTLLDLHPPLSGEVVRARGASVSYVPQRFVFDALVPARAFDLVAEGAERGLSFLRPLRREQDRRRIDEAIEATKTSALLRRRYRELSEGEKQRVLLARAMAGAPDLLVLDEPTSAMDVAAEREVLSLLEELRGRFSMGVLLVSHHVALVAATVDHVLLLDADDNIAVSGRAPEVVGGAAFVERYGSVVKTKAARGEVGGA